MDSMLRLVEDHAPRFAPAHAEGTATEGRGGLDELLLMLGAEPDALRALPPLLVPVRRLHAGDTLFHESAAAESMHFVRAGTFKLLRTAEDGYEQVLGFAGRAELLGFDAIGRGVHPTTAVALEDSSVFTVLLHDFFSIGQRIPVLDQRVLCAASSAMAGCAELADVMAAVAAEVRLARFLLQLSQRMAACGQSPRRFHLRMGRRDIASYLGVAHETVSRSFGALARWGLLRVDNREVEVLDMHALRVLARSTRRMVDEDGVAGPVRLHAAAGSVPAG